MADRELMENKFGGYSLANELNTPTTPSGVISNLYRMFPVNTDNVYQKIGYLVKVLYDILNRDKKNITDYDLKKEYINTQGLPKTELDATAYLADRFKLQSKDDYRNLWFLLRELNNLLNGDDIVRLFTAREIIEGRITYGDMNLNSVLRYMTGVVQNATLSSFDNRKQTLSDEVDGLVNKEAETRSQIASLTQEVERKKAEVALIEPHYKELQKAATTITWEAQKYIIDEDEISTSDIASIIRKQAEMLVEYTGLTLKEAIEEFGKHNTMLFELIDRDLHDLPRIGISNTFGSVAEFVLSNDYQCLQGYKVGNGGNVLSKKYNSRGEKLEHGSVLLYIGLNLNVPENTDDILKAIQERKKELKSNVDNALQGEKLQSKNQELANEIKAKEKLLADLKNNLVENQEIYQKIEAAYAKLQTRIVWTQGNLNHPLYVYGDNQEFVENYYNSLIREYCYRMHVSQDVAKIAIDSYCPDLSDSASWSPKKVYWSKFPTYYDVPKFDLEEFSNQIKSSITSGNTSQLSCAEKIALIAELSSQVKHELGQQEAQPTAGGMGSM